MAEVTIALDAMGGDSGPAELVAGALEAVGDGVGVLLCGRTAELQSELDAQGTDPDLEIVDAPDVIEDNDETDAAVRAKRGSSMRLRVCSVSMSKV
jgi:glycerol-3-phosphate acyltransferase PlsX